MNPHQATKEFERALCEYTGAPYAVAVNSCTMALLLSVAWHMKWRDPGGKPFHGLGQVVGSNEVSIPKRTYVGVPMSIIHAGGRPIFRDEDWSGWYNLHPLPVWDSARWFTCDMYRGALKEVPPLGPVPVDCTGQMVCVSFHAAKTLGDTQGGAILHDNAEADAWLRRARFDGRTEGVPPSADKFTQVGWHCYLSPDVALRLLWRLQTLPKHNDPLPNDCYPDLSLHEAFK